MVFNRSSSCRCKTKYARFQVFSACPRFFLPDPFEKPRTVRQEKNEAHNMRKHRRCGAPGEKKHNTRGKTRHSCRAFGWTSCAKDLSSPKCEASSSKLRSKGERCRCVQCLTWSIFARIKFRLWAKPLHRCWESQEAQFQPKASPGARTIEQTKARSGGSGRI